MDKKAFKALSAIALIALILAAFVISFANVLTVSAAPCTGCKSWSVRLCSQRKRVRNRLRVCPTGEVRTREDTRKLVSFDRCVGKTSPTHSAPNAEPTLDTNSSAADRRKRMAAPVLSGDPASVVR